MTGVDRTQKYLDHAAAEADRANLPVELVHADMRDFRRPGAFDAAINLYTTFGYFADPADDKRVAENLRASLKDGGGLVMEMIGREVLLRDFKPEDRFEADGISFVERRAFDDSGSWLTNRRTIIQGDRKEEMELSHRIYSGPALESLLASAGFGSVRIFGDFGGSPYDAVARKPVAVARF
jgi:SAM-dependent methyltransferase